MSDKKFPDGRLNAEDDGAIAMAIGSENGRNAGDRKRHGHYAVGTDHHACKLTEKQVTAIKGGELSWRDAGISKSQYHRILNGESWKQMVNP